LNAEPEEPLPCGNRFSGTVAFTDELRYNQRHFLREQFLLEKIEMENVSEVLADASAKIDKSFDTLKSQFAGLRTGKASPALVDGVKVDYYGAPTPLKNLATISTPEPRQIKIAPFDPSILGEMNKAILAANLGVTPQTDGRVLRITIPELNEERRKEIVKVAKKQAEDQKIVMRNIRRDANEAVKKLEKDKKITEDERDQGLEKIQKATDEGIARVDAELKSKEAEVMSV
jgi:ribosome recycling factor